MGRGQHAMQDGSFGRSAGSAMARGIALIIAAVAVGILVLKVAGDEQNFETDAQRKARQEAAAEPTTTTPGDSTGTTPPTSPVATAPPATPATTTVLVINGSEVKGAAKTATEQLIEAAFKTVTPTDAPTKPFPTAVYYSTGFDVMGQQIATKLGITIKPAVMPTPPPVDLGGAQVLVIIGEDVAPRFGTTQ